MKLSRLDYLHTIAWGAAAAFLLVFGIQYSTAAQASASVSYAMAVCAG